MKRWDLVQPAFVRITLRRAENTTKQTQNKLKQGEPYHRTEKASFTAPNIVGRVALEWFNDLVTNQQNNECIPSVPL